MTIKDIKNLANENTIYLLEKMSNIKSNIAYGNYTKFELKNAEKELTNIAKEIKSIIESEA